MSGSLTMTPEAQRIAIAEKCGWTFGGETGRYWWKSPHGNVQRILTYGAATQAKVNSLSELPNYLSDLNAMHEAEKMLDANQQVDFSVVLTRPVREEIYEVMPNDLHFAVCFPAIHANAAQRAEAFLRTLNLWDDTK